MCSLVVIGNKKQPLLKKAVAVVVLPTILFDLTVAHNAYGVKNILVVIGAICCSSSVLIQLTGL